MLIEADADVLAVTEAVAHSDAVNEDARVGVRDALGVAQDEETSDDVGEKLTLPDLDKRAVDDEETDGERDTLGLRVGERDALEQPVDEDERLGVRVTAALLLALEKPEGDALTLAAVLCVVDALCVEHCDACAVVERVGEGLLLTDAAPEPDLEAVAQGDALSDAHGLGVWVPQCEAVTLRDALDDSDATLLPVDEGDANAVSDCSEVSVTDALGQGDIEGDTSGVDEELAAPDPVCDVVGVIDTEGLGVDDNDSVGERVSDDDTLCEDAAVADVALEGDKNAVLVSDAAAEADVHRVDDTEGVACAEPDKVLQPLADVEPAAVVVRVNGGDWVGDVPLLADVDGETSVDDDTVAHGDEDIEAAGVGDAVPVEVLQNDKAPEAVADAEAAFVADGDADSDAGPESETNAVGVAGSVGERVSAALAVGLALDVAHAENATEDEAEPVVDRLCDDDAECETTEAEGVGV